MPPVIAAITAVLIDIGISAAVAGFIATTAVTLVASLALGFVSAALLPKPKLPNLSGFQASSRDRLRSVRQPISPWRTVYGELRVGGSLTFIEATNNNDFLHMVITLASHPVQEIGTVMLDDVHIFPDQLDSTGLVVSGKFANLVRIQKDLGTTGEPFPALTSAVTAWTSDHKQAGRAKVYVRLKFDRNVFSNVPNVTAWVKGKKLFDTRTSATVWSPNPILALRDYMTTSTVDGGMGATAVEFDDTFVAAGANVCDEFVSTAETSAVRHHLSSVQVTSASVTASVTTVCSSSRRKTRPRFREVRRLNLKVNSSR